MKCLKCGNELGENDKFCPVCGTPAKEVNEAIKNQNTYTYDRPVNQQINYEGQANNYGQQYGKSKNTNTNDIVKICLITIIVLVILGVLFIIGKTAIKVVDEIIGNVNLSDDYSTTKPDTSTSGTVTSTSSVSTSKSNSYKVSYGGFKLYIPDTLIYEMDYINDAINIGDLESTWIAQLGIRQGSFQQIKQNKSYLSSYLMQELSGATVSNATVETINGVEYVLLECNVAGTNIILGYAGLNSMYSACFEIMNENNDFDRNIIKNLSSIISSAEYTGDSTYMKSNENIKMTDINKVFDKAIETTNKEGE